MKLTPFGDRVLLICYRNIKTTSCTKKNYRFVHYFFKAESIRAEWQCSRLDDLAKTRRRNPDCIAFGFPEACLRGLLPEQLHRIVY
ncbi:hypothetical protein E2C01_022977 [Portunus trituberculatus]|uniref:Uncharacterized protein n=1 Tax=Portunus trituberculatus TaxID=210409 RepID=A0A5B7E8J0_PORTR|nr:hypothetical protein [Portunus trituberculatus]